jgi:hypothetical protein
MNAITFGNHGTNKRCQIRRPTISPLSYFAPSIALHQYQIALHHSGYIIPSNGLSRVARFSFVRLWGKILPRLGFAFANQARFKKDEK